MRVADLGGWTDTWFSGHGNVCNVAVGPGVVVRVRRRTPRPPGVRLYVGGSIVAPGSEPLLEACLVDVGLRGSWQIEVDSAVPPGAALGTSASVTVAMIAALHAVAGHRPDSAELAAQAHRIETGLGWQSGVQDQVAAAFGGASTIDVAYPAFTRRPIEIADAVRAELDHRMLTVYLGAPHVSSEMHELVIASLDPGRSRSGEMATALGPVAAAEEEGRRALVAGDLTKWASALSAATEAMRGLHPGLVSPAADAVIAESRRHGAAGWKVNGAGGVGGTVTVIGPEDERTLTAMREALSRPPWRLLDLRFSPTGADVSIRVDLSYGSTDR